MNLEVKIAEAKNRVKAMINFVANSNIAKNNFDFTVKQYRYRSAPLNLDRVINTRDDISTFLLSVTGVNKVQVKNRDSQTLEIFVFIDQYFYKVYDGYFVTEIRRDCELILCNCFHKGQVVNYILTVI